MVSLNRLSQLVDGLQSEYLYELLQSGRRTEIRVLRRHRKTMALYVERGTGTELRVPVNCSWLDIHRFLESRADWILSAEDDLAGRAVPPADEFHPGGKVSYLGQRHTLDIVQSRFRVVELNDRSLYVSCPNPLNAKRVEQQLLAWFRRAAEQLFKERVDEVLKAFPVPLAPREIKIRKMKSRWGSCSSRGEICLNLLLVREKLPYIDFVIAHELCHLHHFSHNKQFYNLLDGVMPDWRDREAAL